MYKALAVVHYVWFLPNHFVIENICACVQGFDCKELLYTDYKQLPAALEKSLNCRYVKDVAELVKECDIVTINAPLHKVGLP